MAQNISSKTDNNNDKKQVIKSSALKLSVLDSVLVHNGEWISDDARAGARLILSDVIDELQSMSH